MVVSAARTVPGAGYGDRVTGQLADAAGADDWVDDVAALLRDAAKVFVLAGAGMSTESGIPDFRGPNGMWTRNPDAMRMFDLDAYREDPDLRRQAWRLRIDSEIRTAGVNDGHLALAAWESSTREVVVATQNIDGLQQRAGSTSVLELHGTFWQSMCLSCDDRGPIEAVFARVGSGDDDPACERCGGILKTGTVAFGQQLDPVVLAAAAQAAAECDVAFAIGTSLVVQPAAALCDLAVRGGRPLVIVNGSQTPYDDQAAVIVRQPIGAALRHLTEEVG